jgi:hypothetical protein
MFAIWKEFPVSFDENIAVFSIFARRLPIAADNPLKFARGLSVTSKDIFKGVLPNYQANERLKKRTSIWLYKVRS